jgi:hypothetical protein
LSHIGGCAPDRVIWLATLLRRGVRDGIIVDAYRASTAGSGSDVEGAVCTGCYKSCKWDIKLLHNAKRLMMKQDTFKIIYDAKGGGLPKSSLIRLWHLSRFWETDTFWIWTFIIPWYHIMLHIVYHLTAGVIHSPCQSANDFVKCIFSNYAQSLLFVFENDRGFMIKSPLDFIGRSSCKDIFQRRFR